jgi:small GTP-binding protein
MDYQTKISLIGEERTGKTSLILRFLKNVFSGEYITTLGANFIEKSYSNEEIPDLLKKDTFSTVIWDLAGQSNYQMIVPIYCQGSAKILVVFDVNNRKSFEVLPEWVDMAKSVCSLSNIQIIGNKIDLPTVISDEEIKQMEQKLNIHIEFSSAKKPLDDGESNVNNIFYDVARNLYRTCAENKE